MEEYSKASLIVIDNIFVFSNILGDLEYFKTNTI